MAPFAALQHPGPRVEDVIVYVSAITHEHPDVVEQRTARRGVRAPAVLVLNRKAPEPIELVRVVAFGLKRGHEYVARIVAVLGRREPRVDRCRQSACCLSRKPTASAAPA